MWLFVFLFLSLSQDQLCQTQWAAYQKPHRMGLGLG